MKKTFPLHVEGKHPDRLLEATKHEIRKYIRRERRRELPQGADRWEFDCRFGASETTAVPVAESALTASIDAVVAAGGTQFYVEILAKPGQRAARAPKTGDAGTEGIPTTAP
jgi:hypothetical protein